MLGVLVAFILGILLVPFTGDADELTSDSWRVIFLFPIVFPLLNGFLLLFYFKYDTP